jgi:hypothetical protein
MFKYGDTREDGYVFVGWKRRGEKVTPDFREPVKFKKNEEKSKIRKKEKRDKIVAIINEEKIKQGCSYCKNHFENNPEALDFHHPDPSTKIKNVSYYWRSSWAQLEKIMEEYKKCIVLCANCHRIETKRMINE